MTKFTLLAVAISFAMSMPVHANEQEVAIDECSGKDYIELKANSAIRLPPSKPPTIHVLRVPEDPEKVKMKEEKRRSRISEDFDAIKEIAKTAKTATVDNSCVSYQQRLLRATVSVDAIKGEKVVQSFTLIAGPEEHLYLSADLPITDVKQLKFDSATGSVLEKERPASFYISLNWKFGDVFRNYPHQEFYKNVSLKGMVRASSRPSESMGLGVGYNFDGIEIFVARIWTKDDPSVGGGSIGTTPATAFGVSFNVTRAVAWLKGE